MYRERKEINRAELLKSEDLKTFNSDKFSIRENLDSISFYTPYYCENQSGTVKSRSGFSTNEDRSKKCYITLKSLKDKLDIDYEKIFDFYTKIMNKTNFYEQIEKSNENQTKYFNSSPKNHFSFLCQI